MAEQGADERELKEYGQSWEIAAALWGGPKTLPEIVDHFYSYIRLLGFFKITKRMKRRHGKMTERIEETVEALIERGWVVREELTAQARQAFDVNRNPMLRELGVPQMSQAEEMIEQGLAE